MRRLSARGSFRPPLLIAVILVLSAVPALAVVSDDFNSPSLNTGLWTFHDPVGNVSYYASGTNVVVDIPGGSIHDLWSTCNCGPRFVQPQSNSDFGIEVKFDTLPAEKYQMQGIIVGEDFDTYLRFDVQHDGGNASVFAAWVDGGSFSVYHSVDIGAAAAYLRVTRTGNNFLVEYSYDGVLWTPAGNVNRVINVSEVGFFFASSSSSSWGTPSFTGSIDYFFDTSAPMVPEDGGAPMAPTPPSIVTWYGDTQTFGDHGVAEPNVQILGRVSDPDGIATLSYSLNGGPSQPLSIGPSGLRLYHGGDFNAEIDRNDLNPGSNELVITAEDNLAEQSQKVVTLNRVDGVTWPNPDYIDWQVSSNPNDVGQVIDGLWRITPDGVRTGEGGIGYDRWIAIGESTWNPEYEVLVSFLVNRAVQSNAIGIVVGWEQHTGALQPPFQQNYMALGCLSGLDTSPELFLLRQGGLVEASTPWPGAQENVWYKMRIRTEDAGGGMSHVSCKMWEAAAQEPGAWDVEADFTTSPGSILLLADFADVTFGNAWISPLGPTGIAADAPPSVHLSRVLNRPNPYSARTDVDFTLARQGSVDFTVFDVAGRVVYRETLADARAGQNRMIFNGLDSRQQALASGVYFYRLESAGQMVTRKMVITR